MTDDVVSENPHGRKTRRRTSQERAGPRSARCRRGTLTVMYFDEIPVTLITDYVAQLKTRGSAAPAELAQK